MRKSLGALTVTLAACGPSQLRPEIAHPEAVVEVGFLLEEAKREAANKIFAGTGIRAEFRRIEDPKVLERAAAKIVEIWQAVRVMKGEAPKVFPSDLWLIDWSEPPYDFSVSMKAPDGGVFTSTLIYTDGLTSIPQALSSLGIKPASKNSSDSILSLGTYGPFVAQPGEARTMLETAQVRFEDVQLRCQCDLFAVNGDNPQAVQGLIAAVEEKALATANVPLGEDWVCFLTQDFGMQLQCAPVGQPFEGLSRRVKEAEARCNAKPHMEKGETLNEWRKRVEAMVAACKTE